MRPIGRIWDIRSCGAVIVSTPQTSVFSNGRLVAVMGAMDSHGGSALASSSGIFAEDLPVVFVGDYNTSCYYPWPHMGPHPLVTGDYYVAGD